MAKITITIEDSAEVHGRIIVKIDGDYNDHRNCSGTVCSPTHSSSH